MSQNQKWSNADMVQNAMMTKLKAKLSRCLEQVRRGATVDVCDRRTPITRLVPFDGDAGGLEVREPIEASGMPVVPRITLRKQIDVVTLLRADRDALPGLTGMLSAGE